MLNTDKEIQKELESELSELDVVKKLEFERK